jgi:hypothetical protein
VCVELTHAATASCMMHDLQASERAGGCASRDFSTSVLGGRSFGMGWDRGFGFGEEGGEGLVLGWFHGM